MAGWADICDCGEPLSIGDHRRCFLIDSIEDDRDYGDPPEVWWEP